MPTMDTNPINQLLNVAVAQPDTSTQLVLCILSSCCNVVAVSANLGLCTFVYI